jgi:hypothetical protein
MAVMKRFVLTAVLVLASSGIAGVTAADQGLPRVAFFGFQLINTSPQPTTPEWSRTIRKGKLASGHSWTGCSNWAGPMAATCAFPT